MEEIMEEIDQFFAEIKQEYQQKQSLPLDSDKSSTPSPNNNSQEQLDDLLGTFMGDFHKNKKESQSDDQDLFHDIKLNLSQGKNSSKQENLDNAFTELQAQLMGQKKQNQVNILSQKINDKNNQLKANSQLDSVFTELESKFTTKKKSEHLLKADDPKLTEIEQEYKQKKTTNKVSPELNIEAIKEEELNKQRRRKILVKQAEQWLSKLDKYSDEGFWFEQFAESYDSRLEAAIDYLETLNESK
jgi:hypothetical protein